MPEERFQERTEPATPKRRREAREEGKVARSQEVNSAFILLAGLGILALGHRFFLGRLAEIVRALLASSAHIEISPDLLLPYLGQGLPYVLLTLAPLAGGIMLVGLGVNFAQVGFVLSWKPLAPRLSMLNPVNGFSRIFSKHGAVELAKSLAKVAIVALVAWMTLKAELPTLASQMGTAPMPAFAYAASVALKLGLRVALAMLFLALLDYGFQRWDYEKSIMMSRRELEEEMRQTEGDPRVRARIRAVQREVTRRRMMEKVKTADVVVTNPTRIAVALKYDRKSMRAPKVVAKGARLIAQRIREIAQKHDVPIVEDPPLARLLYKVEIDREIPVALFQAVAELLAYVYRLKDERRMARAGLRF